MSEFLSKEGLEFIAENYLILDKDIVFKSETLDYRENEASIYDPNIQDTIYIKNYIVIDEGSLFLEEHQQIIKIKISKNFSMTYSYWEGRLNYLQVLKVSPVWDDCGTLREDYDECARLHLNGCTKSGEFCIYRKNPGDKDWYLLNDHEAKANPHNITKSTVGLDKVENKSVSNIVEEFNDYYYTLPRKDGKAICAPTSFQEDTIYSSGTFQSIPVYVYEMEDPFNMGLGGGASTPIPSPEFYIQIPQQLSTSKRYLVLSYQEDECSSSYSRVYIPINSTISEGIYKCQITESTYIQENTSAYQFSGTMIPELETNEGTKGNILELVGGVLMAHAYANANTPNSLISRDSGNRAFINPPQNGEGGRYQIANRIYVDNKVGGSTSINLGAGQSKTITFSCSNHEGTKTDVPRGLYNGTGMYVIYANSAATISIVDDKGEATEFQGKFLILSVSPHSETKTGIRINTMYYNSLLDAGWKHAYTVLGKTMTIKSASNSETFVHYHQVSPFRCNFPV